MDWLFLRASLTKFVDTWLNPVFDFMKVISFEKIWVHYPFDLLPQPDDQLHAAGHQAHTGKSQNGSQDDKRANKVMIIPKTEEKIKSGV